MNIRKKSVVFAVLALLLLSLPAASVSAYTPSGVGTPGYWKNHPEAWPQDFTITIRDEYDTNLAIETMKMPTKGDKTYTMFRALVAAKLNGRNNDHSCIDDTVKAAIGWMWQHPAGSGVKANSDAWKVGEPLYEVLDDYNNGLLCAPSRDSLE
jgi:hypothetical protein